MPHKEGIAVCGCVAGVLALEGSVGVGSGCGGDVLCEGFWLVELILVFIWMVSLSRGSRNLHGARRRSGRCTSLC